MDKKSEEEEDEDISQVQTTTSSILSANLSDLPSHHYPNTNQVNAERHHWSKE
jgi:hypothetical protein